MKRKFNDKTPQEVLALALKIEQSNAARLETLAGLYVDYDQDVHQLFVRLREEELEHATRLEQAWDQHFGNEPKPEIQEADVRNVIEAADREQGEQNTIFNEIGVSNAFKLVRKAEKATHEFYTHAEEVSDDANLKSVYRELAASEMRRMTTVDEERRPEFENGGRS